MSEGMQTNNGHGGMTEYQEFLHSKIAVAEQTGCAEIADSDIHPILKPHQRAIVRWAVQGGRRAIFASFGLGKTLMQLEIARLVLKHHGGGKALIVTPLGIRQEFTRDAAMIGQTITFIRRIEEAANDGLYIINYESIRDGKLDPRGFDVVSLDEASILRGFGGTKTFRELMKIYEGTAIESCVNIGLGYGVAILSQIAVFPLFEIRLPLRTNLWIGAWFTGINLIRSYAIRRGFNWWHHRGTF